MSHWGGPERAVEGSERDFEVDDIVCCRLNADALEDGVLQALDTPIHRRPIHEMEGARLQ
jgi:hypothetical protein